MFNLPLVQHICCINGSDNDVSTIRRQAIILINAEILSIGPSGTNFSDTLIKIQKRFIQENTPENIVC